MFLKLFLLFTLLPSFELWLLFQVKEQLGLFETIWLDPNADLELLFCATRVL